MSGPAVTVLMPVFNAARHVRESVASVLRQSFCDFELLAIDDGSTDESAKILASLGDPRVRVLRNERNLGLVATLNRGLAEARGEWIARQDADDLSAPGRLASQMAFARGNPAVPLVGSDALLIDDAGRPRGRWRTGGHADLVAWELCFRAPFAHSSALFRRSIVCERLGGYREMRACEDLDLWSRVATEFPVVTLREPLVKYRLHEASIMACAEDDAERIEAVRGVLERHMAAMAPGLADAERACIAAAWSGGATPGWRAYFDAVAMLELNFLRGRRKPPGFSRVLADEHYSLWFRAGRPAAFLVALAKADPSLFATMPWLRMAAGMVLNP
jgi:glycosyltransferase involved in cell wall biosynthesis